MSLASLPAIVAVLERRDYGPSDGAGSASCPHCGASGRYVYSFLCDDGTRRGAMSGCIKLFRQSPQARLVAEAFDRQAETKPGQKLASWWKDMLTATADLEAGTIDAQTFNARISTAERARQAWLQRNGYGKWRRR